MTKPLAPVVGPWGELTLPPGESHELELGTLRMALKRTASEVWLRMHRSPGGDPVSADWIRWATSKEARIEVRPAVPDRLVVVSHERPYHLPSGGTSQVFVRIPLFIQVAIIDEDREVIAADEPSIVLSDTWWGTFTEGELAYWLTTKARTELSDDLFLPHFGMCPIRMVNHSEDSLPVERFAVRVPHLSLFSDRGRNWTDQVNVRYEDSPEGSEIRFAREAPEEARAAHLLAEPRIPLDRGFHAKTFDRLRSLSSLGN